MPSPCTHLHLLPLCFPVLLRETLGYCSSKILQPACRKALKRASRPVSLEGILCSHPVFLQTLKSVPVCCLSRNKLTFLYSVSFIAGDRMGSEWGMELMQLKGIWALSLSVPSEDDSHSVGNIPQMQHWGNACQKPQSWFINPLTTNAAHKVMEQKSYIDT